MHHHLDHTPSLQSRTLLDCNCDRSFGKWSPRTTRMVNSGFSLYHALSAPLVLNPNTGSFTPQWNVVLTMSLPQLSLMLMLWLTSTQLNGTKCLATLYLSRTMMKAKTSHAPAAAIKPQSNLEESVATALITNILLQLLKFLWPLLKQGSRHMTSNWLPFVCLLLLFLHPGSHSSLTRGRIQ